MFTLRVIAQSERIVYGQLKPGLGDLLLCSVIFLGIVGTTIIHFFLNFEIHIVPFRYGCDLAMACVTPSSVSLIPVYTEFTNWQKNAEVA